MDLDGTIFQTRRKREGSRLTAAADGPDGKPLSFMTPPQGFLLGELLKEAITVPVTARNMASYGRVRLKFTAGAILDFGGLILLPSGEIDRSWLSAMKEKTEQSSGLLAEAFAFCQAFILKHKLCARVRLLGDAGLTFYLIVKTEINLLQELDLLYKELRINFSEGVRIYLNDNNLSLLPDYLDKGPAVSYFIDTLLISDGNMKREDLLLIGLGDSLSDKGFLKLCDYVVIPSESQLGGLL
jgi:hypothetical protein